MVLKSLIAEITGQVPPQASDISEEIAPGRRLVVIFEDTLGALREWQNELLRTDGDALRHMNMWVACVPSDGHPALLNGRVSDFPVEELRHALSEGSPGQFQVVLLDVEGDVILRADGPVTIEQLSEAVDRIPPLPQMSS
ncbi:hypothetical protein J2X76_006241 [Neorhizobium sp. 2083]|uniref:DUF4174 domain-containing protein n=1 Tax=Neorhizobium sp. 2083 TaxID=2817762 RepID=UPI00285FD282|nr:DUF4174 domain-containing protein [Neorhizobium sp. 2083]MDR6821041.1 hypothetical protein [Neorhizobium sp. 2083]